MNTLIKNNLVISQRWQPSPYHTGLGSYWIWTGKSVKAISNEYPAKVSSRAFSFPEVKMKKRNNWLIFSLMALYLTFFGFISLTHGEEEENKVHVETKEISGEVGGMIFPRFISITYKKEEGVAYDKALNISEEVELVRFKDLKSLSLGDSVRVEYEESTQEVEEIQPDGSVETKTKILNRVATKITFLRPASDTLRSGR